LVLCAAVVGTGQLLTHGLSGSVGARDDDLARWFAARRTPGLDVLAELGTFIGDTVVGLVVLTVLGVAFARAGRSWRPLVLVLVSHVGLFAIYLLATAVDPRRRPPVAILDAGLVPDHSFPSGHVMTTSVVVGCALLLTHAGTRVDVRWLLPLLALPPATALARMYQGAHHLTDVLTSLLCASLWLSVTGLLLLGGRPPAAD
jgi:undecaprenyl-diphosphatase